MRKSKTETELIQALPEDEEIHAEYKRLLKLFKNVQKKKLDLARKLVSRAAFLSVATDRLEKEIIENGFEEEYQNGANQKGKKKSAAAELHVAYTKNLLSTMKQLNDMLLIDDTGESDGFENY